MIFLKSIKRNMLIISLMYCLIGYLLIIGQGINNHIILSTLAIGIGLAGLFSMIGYLLSKIDERYKRNEFVYGALLLIIAVFLYIEAITFIKLKMIVSMALGMSAIIKIQDLFDSRAIGKKVASTYFALALLCAVLSVFIWQSILIKESFAFYVYGVAMIIAGLSDLLSNLYLAAARHSYEIRMRKEAESEKILEEAEKNVNLDESKPVSFIEKILYEPDDEPGASINIELTEKEKNMEPLKDEESGK